MVKLRRPERPTDPGGSKSFAADHPKDPFGHRSQLTHSRFRDRGISGTCHPIDSVRARYLAPCLLHRHSELP